MGAVQWYCDSTPKIAHPLFPACAQGREQYKLQHPLVSSVLFLDTPRPAAAACDRTGPDGQPHALAEQPQALPGQPQAMAGQLQAIARQPQATAGRPHGPPGQPHTLAGPTIILDQMPGQELAKRAW